MLVVEMMRAVVMGRWSCGWRICVLRLMMMMAQVVLGVLVAMGGVLDRVAIG